MSIAGKAVVGIIAVFRLFIIIPCPFYMYQALIVVIRCDAMTGINTNIENGEISQLENPFAYSVNSRSVVTSGVTSWAIEITLKRYEVNNLCQQTAWRDII